MSATVNQFFSHRLCVAPMIDWTDRHCRYWLRIVSPNARLYTEMITTQAILHGDVQKLLAFDVSEHPLALQLGGSDPKAFAQSAKIAADFGFDEININVGCPSSRVQQGRFGACLFKEPNIIAECVSAIQDVVTLPVTIKTRIGVDDHDDYTHLHHFITTTAASGCQVFIIHARKAWLNGLSPKENRTIPPLKYEVVTRLQEDFPALQFILNGGITAFDQATELSQHYAGLMLGRSAYHDPFLLTALDTQLFGTKSITRAEALKCYFEYAYKQFALGIRKHSLLNPILGAYHGLPNGKRFRRFLGGENLPLPELFNEAMKLVDVNDVS